MAAWFCSKKPGSQLGWATGLGKRTLRGGGCEAANGETTGCGDSREVDCPALRVGLPTVADNVDTVGGYRDEHWGQDHREVNGYLQYRFVHGFAYISPHRGWLG